MPDDTCGPVALWPTGLFIPLLEFDGEASGAMHGIWEKVHAAAETIRGQWSGTPSAGLILGTGLGGLAEQIDQQAAIPYGEIPGFPISTAPGHAGRLVCGTLKGVPIVAMEGRFHYYEGYSLEQVTFPVRVMKALGAKLLIATNAAGGINPQLDLGGLVLIEDHINLLPDNPLRGVNDDRLGPRWPDLCAPYTRSLIDLTREKALALGIQVQKGVFVAVAGPNLETRAEYRMLKNMGADVVGMSTVPEVLVAVHSSMEVLAFSVVTDLCLPDNLAPVEVPHILANAAIGGEKLARLIPEVLQQWSVR